MAAKPEGPGFYKAEGAMLLYAPTAVHAPDFAMTIQGHGRGEYAYPRGGWSWFPNSQAAEAALGATLPV